ncbi:MAG: NAD-binding protein [Patescibacteria group bacterium]|nr:NAD-binding protein [Patescibacteria group bacterium]MCL5093816.1 NAD-binding protein [Patescibacteria group bacterium]
MRRERNIGIIFLLFLLLVFLGTIGFIVLKDMPPWLAFYQTSHLLLSHFYDYKGEAESFGIQVLTLILITGSLIIVVYIFKLFGDYFLGGALKQRIKEMNINKSIANLKDHFIVCGYGRVGKQVAEEFNNEKVKFVIIDRDKNELALADKKGYLYIVGDPTNEENLISAKIDKAKGLVAALGEDADNLFLTMSARSFNTDIFIVARANEEVNVKKFEKAGADRVALPYKIGGYHMGTMALRPAVVDFLDVIVDGNHKELQVEEVVVPPTSELVGQSIVERIPKGKTRVTILAINKADGRSIINPSGNDVLEANDKLIVLGTKNNLESVFKVVEQV